MADDATKGDITCPGVACRHRLAFRWALRGDSIKLEVVCADGRCRRFYTKWIPLEPIMAALSLRSDKAADGRSGPESDETAEEAPTPGKPLSGPPASPTGRSRRWRAT